MFPTRKNSQFPFILNKTYAATMVCLAFAASSHAAVLTGSGPFLPLPSPNPPWPVGVAPTYTTVSGSNFGTWTAGTVQPAWAGTFGMSTPPIPSLSTGTTFYDFTTLPLGFLPAGTFFYFGDVDGGSTNPERFNLAAFDISSSVITNEWLDDTYAVTGTGTGTGGAIQANDLPSWDWNISNPNQYQIAASLSPSGNPNVGTVLQTNQAIYGMRLEKPETHYGFNILAPPANQIPEPSSALLVGLATVVGVCRRQWI